MTFSEAKDYVMPFGKYRGMKLDQIAHDDRGLQYLDWLRDKRREDTKDYGRNGLDDALDAYLDDPAIQKDLEES